MILFGLFALAIVFYSSSAWISYNPDLKYNILLYPLTMVCSMVGAAIWVTIVRNSETQHDILINGTIFDSIILITFTTIPFLCYNTKLSYRETIGLSVIILGILIVKLWK